MRHSHRPFGLKRKRTLGAVAIKSGARAVVRAKPRGRSFALIKILDNARTVNMMMTLRGLDGDLG